MKLTLEVHDNHFEAFINLVNTIDYIDIVESEKPQEKGKAYDINQIRKKYPNAYEPWTAETDKLLEINFCKGKNKDELSDIFGRNVGAIESRIKKLELQEKYG